MSNVEHRSRVATLLILLALLTAGWFLYLPATSGAFALDDTENIRGLAAVDDATSALRFVFSGDAGPLGRPIALASFLPQAGAHDEGAAPFLYVNILIHLLNATLVAALLLRLAGALSLSPVDRRIAALAAAALWLLMPLLASASLAVVQRMTTLSATFVLLGLLGYLAIRNRSAGQPRTALAGMTAVLGLATLLAVFTKENGALLPTLVLVLEVTLLTPLDGVSTRAFRNWRIAVLGLPTLAILGYVALRLPYSEATVLARDFTGLERLMTEARLLWLYLAQAFAPLPGWIAPVNDIHPVVRSPWQPLTLAAMLSWPAILVLAIRYRRRAPLASFAALWFLAGHLLESTVLQLELYFAHRNYLPMIGPVFAAVAGGLSIAGHRRGAVRAGLAVYVLAMGASLYSLTTLWGQPELSARYWYLKHPDSVRAATRLVSMQLDTEGVNPAIVTLNRFVDKNPGHAYLLIQDLNIRCRLEPQGDHSARVSRLRELLGQVEFTYTAGTMLSQLVNVAAQENCRTVDAAALRALATALRDNRRYRDDRRFNGLYHKVTALIYRLEGDMERAVDHLAEAAHHDPGKDTTMLQILTLAQAGQFDRAGARIAEAREQAPRHPVHNFLWREDLDDMERYVAELRAHDDSAAGDGS